MSAGLSNLSNDDLMRMLGQAPAAPGPAAPGPSASPPAPAAPDLMSLSDDDLVAMLKGAPSTPPAPAASFDERFRGNSVGAPVTSANADTSSKLGAALQAKADERLVGPASTRNAVEAALYSGANAFGLNLPRNITAGIEAYRSGKSFDQAYRGVKDVEDALARQNPKSAIAGTVAGAIGSAPLMPGLAGAPAASLGGRALQYGITGGLYGAGAELADSKDLGRAGLAGGLGFAGGAGLGPAVEKAAPVAGNLLDRVLVSVGAKRAPAPRTTFLPAEETALRDAGFDPAAISADDRGRFLDAFRTKGVSAAAAREAQAAEFGVPLSRGQATGDLRAGQFESEALAGRRGTRAQSVGSDFGDRQRDALEAAQGNILGRLAGGHPVLDDPTAGGEAAAGVLRRYVDDAASRGSAAQREADEALAVIRGPGVAPDTLDAAGAVSQATREAAAQSRAAYRGAYDEVAAIPGTFTPGALDRMGSRVRERLGADFPIDDVVTPNASRALADLDNIPGVFGLEPGQGPNLQQVETLRRRLGRYSEAAGQNRTDREAVRRIREELDSHVEDAMSIGAFGQQRGGLLGGPVDDFPGFPPGGAPAAAADNLAGAVEAPGRAPETMGQFIARNGGLELSDDARAADFHRWQVGGLNRLARPGGTPMDDLRDKLVVAGFIRPDEADGSISRNITDEVMEALRSEKMGRPRVRFEDEGRAANTRAASDRVADENAEFSAQLDRQRRTMLNELSGLGLRPRDVDKDILDDAAERMLRGETNDAADAYERAVQNRVSLDLEERGAAAASGDVPFPELGERAAAAAGGGDFPAGDTGALQALRNARGLFRDHKQAFAPRGPGDTAGRNLQKIVDRDATPNEVASALFGGQTGRVSGRQLETLDRVRDVVGADSDAWRATQQAVMGRYLDGRDVGRSLDYLLRGEGRELANRVLSEEQRRGLAAFRDGTRRAENARESVPSWISDVAAGGYDPNRILRDMFGSGVPGSRPGQPAYARGLRTFLGGDSAEWSGLRQAAWQTLTKDADKVAPGKLADRIRAFTEGQGRGLADEMFQPEELALFNRYADTLRSLERPKGGRVQDDGRLASAGAHIVNVLAGAIGFKAGGPAGAAAAYGARVGQRALVGGLSAGRASRSFNEGAPRVPSPAPAYAVPFGFGGAGAAGLGTAYGVPSGY